MTEREFNVTIERTILQEAELFIFADNLADAERRAIRMAEERSINWQDVGVADFQITHSEDIASDEE